MRLVALLIFPIAVATAATTETDGIARGEVLYNAAGSCVACHMADGAGIPGSIPPLKGSPWLNNPQRTIAITLRGLEGPILVDGKRFHSAMPPQVLFNAEELALIITYINQAWGNNYPAVSARQVEQANENLPTGVYSHNAIIKAFPFNKKLRRTNGIFKPDYDDKLGTITTPVVYRTFMPGASPAAFAIALPGEHYYCWDAGECRLRYVWSDGGFIKGNMGHWSSNGKPVAEFHGKPYYQAHATHLQSLSPNIDLSSTEHTNPIYDTTQAQDFPISIDGVTTTAPRYKGYRLIDGYPEFWYRLGEHDIYERITCNNDQTGIVRHFRVNTAGNSMTLQLTPDPKAMLDSSVGTITPAGSLTLNADQAQSFSVTIIERSRFTPSNGGAE